MQEKSSEKVFCCGRPIFERTVVRLGSDKEFTILANRASARNKYIQSAQLNGKPLNRPWFGQSDIADGCTLVLQMGDRPNRGWRSSRQDAPHSIGYGVKNAGDVH